MKGDNIMLQNATDHNKMGHHSGIIGFVRLTGLPSRSGYRNHAGDIGIPSYFLFFYE